MSASPRLKLAKQKAKKLQQGHFLQDTKEELKKVSWTSKKELISYTKVVIFSTFVFGFAIYLADLSIRGGLDGLSNIVRWMVG
ncbi:MAG: preprotein translocase subunit SecE [Chlamydiales bacterium]|nr:preprotein translocase subunit SecE [Chlamydiales bacterium]